MEHERKGHLVALPCQRPDEMSDADLVAGVVEGDKGALRAVWDRYIASVRATLRSCLGGDHIVDDLAQEVFLSFYRSAARLRDPAALRPYLLGSAAKIALCEMRSRSRRTRWYRLFHWSSNIGRTGQGPDIDERDALRKLRELLSRLPQRESQAFVLRHVHEMSPAEVAQALGIPLGTAKRAISEGRRRVLLRAQQEPALSFYLRSSQERP
jgi:RNA polymerase sigma-70 factor (ECF subfamily)